MKRENLLKRSKNQILKTGILFLVHRNGALLQMPIFMAFSANKNIAS